MIWRDMLIDRRPTDSELQHALAQAFQTALDEVTLFGDYRELLAPEPPGTQLLCERLPTNGEFRMKLGIMPIHPQLVAFTHQHSDIGLLLGLCQTLNVCGLIDDGTENSYAFVLLEPDGVVTHTALDAERLDMDEQYVLVPQTADVGD